MQNANDMVWSILINRNSSISFFINYIYNFSN